MIFTFPYHIIIKAVREDVCALPELPEKYRKIKHISEEERFLSRTAQRDIECIMETLSEMASGGIKNSFAAPLSLADHPCGAAAFLCGDSALRHMRDTEELFKESLVSEGLGG